jgi:hypothetical protein
VTDGYDPTRTAATKGSDTLRLGACLGHFRSRFRSWASKLSETVYIEFRKRLKSVLQSSSEPLLKVFRFAHRMRALIGWAAKNLGPEFAAELRDRYERHRDARARLDGPSDDAPQ